MRNWIVLAPLFGLTSCDVVAPNRAARSVFRSADNLEVTLTVEPGNVPSGQGFFVTTTAINRGSAPVTIAAPYSGLSGGVPTRYLAQERLLTFERRDGQSHQLSTGSLSPLCMLWHGFELAGSDVVRTLAPGEKLVDCRIEYLAIVPTENVDTPPGEYVVKWNPEIRVVSPTAEQLPAFQVEFEVVDP